MYSRIDVFVGEVAEEWYTHNKRHNKAALGAIKRETERQRERERERERDSHIFYLAHKVERTLELENLVVCHKSVIT